MYRRRRGGALSAALVAAVIALTMALTSISLGASSRQVLAAGGPTLTATPASAITDGQFVKLSFSGYPASTPLDFLQCNAAPVDPNTDCTAVNAKFGFAQTDTSGAGSTFFPLYDGTDPNLENAAGTGTLSCDVTHPCVIAAVTQLGFTSAVFATVNFAPSPDLCPQTLGGKIVGNGAASAYRAMYQWESAVCQPPSSLPIGYTLGNSPFGVTDFLQGVTQYAVTGPWGPTYVPSSSSTPPQTWAYAPLTLSGVVIAYRMYDKNGNQITNLTLTPQLIAQVFLGQVPDFNSGTFNCASQPTYPPCEIEALNPGIQFPNIVYPFVRAESDSESWVFTSWLASAAASAWVQPAGPQAGTPIGASEIFPVFSSFVTAATGSAAVAFKVVTPPPTGFPLTANIGFMDTTTAAYYGLPTVNIKRADGSVTQADSATISAAVADATVNSDGTIIPNYGTTDPNAWPMLLPTEMMVPTNKVAAQAGADIASFLRYAVGSGQTSLPAGYATLTPTLVNDSLAAAAKIPTSMSTPTPSPSASPSPTPARISRSPSPYPTARLMTGGGASPTPGKRVHATPSLSTHSTPAPSVGGTVPLAQLLLSADNSRFLLPAAAAAAVAALAAGLVVEVAGRVRRRTARRSTRG